MGSWEFEVLSWLFVHVGVCVCVCAHDETEAEWDGERSSGEGRFDGGQGTASTACVSVVSASEDILTSLSAS